MIRSVSRRALLLSALAGGACSSDSKPALEGAAAPQGTNSAPVPAVAETEAPAPASPAATASPSANGSSDGAGTNAEGTPDVGGLSAVPASPGGAADMAAAGPVPMTGPAAVDPGSEGDGDFTVGPNYTRSPDLAMKDVPGSRVFGFTLASGDSKIFTGTDAELNPPMAFTRSIRVSIPSQYVDGAEAPFMVTSDGFYGGIQTAVDNLVGDPDPQRRVPPLVVIGVQNGPLPNNERSVEYDTVSDRYWRFITSEVIPAVLGNAQLRAAYPNFKLTSNPDGRGAYGCSSGGPAAFGMGWFGDFTRLLIFSGSFTDLQKTDAATDALHPLGAWEYPSMIAAAPLTPLRVFLEVGENDNGSTTAEATHRNWVIANRNMAAALKEKGNHYRFVYATGAGHCDDNPRNQVMPEGLIWLWRGYQAQ
jgi:iron(III)-enterobactin esterase